LRGIRCRGERKRDKKSYFLPFTNSITRPLKYNIIMSIPYMPICGSYFIPKSMCSFMPKPKFPVSLKFGACKKQTRKKKNNKKQREKIAKMRLHKQFQADQLAVENKRFLYFSICHFRSLDTPVYIVLQTGLLLK